MPLTLTAAHDEKEEDTLDHALGGTGKYDIVCSTEHEIRTENHELKPEGMNKPNRKNKKTHRAHARGEPGIRTRDRPHPKRESYH